MIVCNNKEDYEILKSLRSHGWARDEKTSRRFPNLDPRYIFVNSGFNFRPTDIQGAIGLSQFNKLDKFKRVRIENRKRIIESFLRDKRWQNQFDFLEVPKNINQVTWYFLF